MKPPLLTPDQARAVEAPGSVAVTAGAGTGKTHMLTERYVHHVVVDGLGPLQIVAATFTDRAAAELRSRIRTRLSGAGQREEQTAELEAAQIGTLHSLAGRICREHPEAAGVPFDFRLLDPLEQRLWLERHFAEAIDGLAADIAAHVPFQTLVATLRALLADPYTAERALAVDASAWPELFAEERKRLLRDLARREAWQHAVATLREHAGPPTDKMEQQRAAAVAALDAFAAGEFTAEACTAVDTLNAGRGSKKAWSEPVLDELKKACVAVRGMFREGKHVFAVEFGEADEILARAQVDVRRAFTSVRSHLMQAKREQRVLDFNDLEIFALQALRDPQVQEFYRARWKAFLVDEFQDTNPVQAELLDRLTVAAKVTVVGDEKQSIYGFRRADVNVFRGVRRQIQEEGGDVIELATSFRTHRSLVEPVNAVVRPALADLHQALDAARVEVPGEGPYLTVQLMTAPEDVRKPFRRRAEAHRVGEIVEHRLLAGEARVFDKASGGLRSVLPGDIVVLARTWSELEPFGVELAARGISTIHAGGGDLFGQREVKDGMALLRFLADPQDDLSLAAVLRSPFFAVSDPELSQVAGRVQQERWGTGATGGPETEAPSWWSVLAGEASRPGDDAGPLPRAVRTLADLLEHARKVSPRALLDLADDLTAYTATVANLPGGPRRLADWRGFVDLVETLGQRHESLFTVVRQLGELVELEGSNVPRPALEAGDAVSLMTVHNAKGLEWPVVILPDVTSRSSGRSVDALFDAEAGVAFQVRTSSGSKEKPALFQLLHERAKAREAEEEMRVLYVALTRARDRLFLTGNEESGGKLEDIGSGLADAGIEPEVAAYEPEHAVPRTPRPEPLPEAGEHLLDAPGPGLEHLPATALTTYAVCPKRFELDWIEGHPGAPVRPEVASRSRALPPGGQSEAAMTAADSELAPDAPWTGRQLGQRIGTLAHKALELDIASADELHRHDPALEPSHVARALELANVFLTSPVFEGVRGAKIVDREKHCSLPIDKTHVYGVADVVGRDFVLDYKTGDPAEDEAHALQVAIYSEALDMDRAYIAYLRTEDDPQPPELVESTGNELVAAQQRVRTMLAGIRAGTFAATPGEDRCAKCAFEAICDASAWKA